LRVTQPGSLLACSQQQRQQCVRELPRP